MRITPLPQRFGAEIAGFDIHDGRSPEEIAALKSAYDEHNLLIFRDCGRISVERQVELAGWFGPVVDHGAGVWTVLDNTEASGSKPLPFHCDITFVEHPLDGISLHPLELPNCETSTTFVSNALAWADLPAATQDKLRGLKARHYYADSDNMDFDWPVLEYWHPVCLAHRTTGRPMLFVTEHHVDRVEGMNEGAGAELLGELFSLLYAPKRRYEHVWREGDFLIWDNFAIQHARTRSSEPADGPRVLRRVSMGAHGFMEQLERARERQRAA